MGGGIQDWFFWATGAVLALAGIALIAWGRVWDRSRGRKRCPKCWYSMEGVPATTRDGKEAWTCPECGTAIAGPRGLYRSRRRVWPLSIGAVLLLAAWPAAQFMHIREEGWIGLIPTSLLVVIAKPDRNVTAQLPTGVFIPLSSIQTIAPTRPPRRQPTVGESMSDAAWRRILDGVSAQWQARHFCRRYFRAQGISPEGPVRVPARWVKGEPVPVLLGQARTVQPRIWMPGMLSVRDAATKPGAGLGGTAGASVALLPGLQRGPVRFVLDASGWRGALLYSQEVELPIDLVDSATELVVPVDSPEISQSVRSAMDLQLVRSFDELIVLSQDRNDGPAWQPIDFSVVYTVEVLVGGSIVGTAGGATHPGPGLLPWKNWRCLTVEWAPGGRALVEGQPDGARLLVRGDLLRMLRMYEEWPFDTSSARVWNGSFEMPVRVEDVIGWGARP